MASRLNDQGGRTDPLAKSRRLPGSIHQSNRKGEGG
jgi:hypothetical protein